MGKGTRLRERRQAVAVARNEQMRRAATEPAAIIIRCPVTDKYVPTGIQAAPDSFSQATFEDMTSECPHCGGEHRWGDAEMALDN